MDNQIEIYQGSDGQAQIEVRFEEDSVWLNQKQMSVLFDKYSDTIGLHLKNIYKDGELEESSTAEDSSVVRKGGKRLVRRKVRFYNLDAIISVGYRANSKRGIQFCQWATKRLKVYLLQGYAINEQRLEQKQQQMQTLKDGIRVLGRVIEEKAANQNQEWLNYFAKDLELLNDYDHENLDKKGLTKRTASYPSLSDYHRVIASMRSDLESGVLVRKGWEF